MGSHKRVAHILCTVAVLAATVAWSGWATLSTVLNPDRSEKLAQVIYDDPTTRAQLIKEMSSSFAAAGGINPGFTDADINAATAAALSDPSVRTGLIDAIVDTHREALGAGDGVPPVIKSQALAVATTNALRTQRPDLAAQVPNFTAPDVPLPTNKMPKFGAVRNILNIVVGPAAVLAVLTGLAAIFAGGGQSVKRIGRWAFGAGLIWALIGLAGPYMAGAVMSETKAVLAGTVIDALFGTVIKAAIVLCLAGAGAWFGGRALMVAEGRPKGGHRPVKDSTFDPENPRDRRPAGANPGRLW